MALQIFWYFAESGFVTSGISVTALRRKPPAHTFISPPPARDIQPKGKTMTTKNLNAKNLNANTATVLTAAISDDVRQSHIATLTDLGKAVAGVAAAKDIAAAVFNAMPGDYDWTAKEGKSTALTTAIHMWAVGTADLSARPQMTRPSGESDGKRVRTHYAVGVDAVAKHLRTLAGIKAEKATDWLGLAVQAAMNASNNGIDLADILSAVVDALPETGYNDAAYAEAVLSAGKADLSLAV